MSILLTNSFLATILDIVSNSAIVKILDTIPNTLTIRDTVSTSVMILLTLIVEVLILDIVAMIPLHLYSISDSVIPISSAIIRSKLLTLNLNCSTDTDSWIALNNDLTLSVDS